MIWASAPVWYRRGRVGKKYLSIKEKKQGRNVSTRLHPSFSLTSGQFHPLHYPLTVTTLWKTLSVLNIILKTSRKSLRMHERRLERTLLLYFISFNPKRARGKSRCECVNIPPPHGHADNFMSIDRVSWFITARPDSVYAPRTSSSSHFLTKIDAWKFGRALASRLSVCGLKEGICEIQPEKCLPLSNERERERGGKKRVSCGRMNKLVLLIILHKDGWWKERSATHVTSEGKRK